MYNLKTKKVVMSRDVCLLDTFKLESDDNSKIIIYKDDIAEDDDINKKEETDIMTPGN